MSTLVLKKLRLRTTLNKVSLSKIKDTISELGYGIATRKSIFPVTGMMCATCVAHVEEALKSVPGVVSAAVNLGSEKATVEYLESTDYSDLKKAVTDAGYELGAELKALEDVSETSQREVRKIRNRFIFAAYSHHSDCCDDADSRFQGHGIPALGAGHPGAILGGLAFL